MKKPIKPNLNPLRRVAKLIQKRPKEFNMTYFTGYQKNECGTTHCIAGWLEELYPDKIAIIHEQYPRSITEGCAVFLKIEHESFYKLAFGKWEGQQKWLTLITVEEAVTAINDLINKEEIKYYTAMSNYYLQKCNIKDEGVL